MTDDQLILKIRQASESAGYTRALADIVRWIPPAAVAGFDDDTLRALNETVRELAKQQESQS